MTVDITKGPDQLRPFIAGTEARLDEQKCGSPLLPPRVFTGDGTETSFALPAGQTAYAVFLAGAVQIMGASDHYTITTDVTVRSVVFNVAPAGAAEIVVFPMEA